MKTIPYWLAGLIGACMACAAAATEAPPAQPLTLPELTAIALRNHPDTRIAWATLAQSQAAERIARAGWWPTITASYSAQRSRSITSGGAEVPAQTRYGPSVSLSYLLFDFGTRGSNIERAAAERMASEFSLNQTLQNVVLAVESSYYTVIGSAALVDAAQRALDEAQANLDAARTKHAAGLATVADVYQAEAARAAAQLTLQRAQGDYRIAQGALAGALGYSPATPLQLVDWAPDQAAIERPAPSLGELLERARRARPELLAAQASEQAASAAVRTARGNALPTLRLNGSAGQTRIVDRGSSEQYSAGVTLSVPVFQGFALRAAIDGARASLDSARASTDALRLSVEQQVWSAYQSVDTAYGNLDASRVQLESAERAAEAIRARYKNGLSSILEVLTTESTLAQARVARIQAFLDWYLALATLAHDAGGLHAAVDSPDTGALP